MVKQANNVTLQIRKCRCMGLYNIYSFVQEQMIKVLYSGMSSKN